MKYAIIFMLLTTPSLYADSKQKDKMMKPMEMTMEQRQTMATHHEKMAACLRSDKSLETCQKEMMDDCKSTLGEDACKMPKMQKMKKMMK